jgi:hypothetical protein
MSEFQNESLATRRGRPPLNRETSPEVAVVPPVAEPGRRVTRKPFSSVELKLAYEPREGFHRHWFNDTNNRIHRAQEAGYEHVKGRDGKNVSRVVGVADGGGPLHAFLMEIPEEWYKEDVAREQALIAERESAIKKGKPMGGEVEQGYVPSQGISIR